VVSGVGGQYNFVAQAHELENARSIILLKAVRNNNGKAESNIVWSYGHTTVPRHLRDIFITEYGVADLRGQTDEECVRRMLAITDARFQDGLVQQAISAKKLPRDFAVPAAWRANSPETIERALMAHSDALPSYPFGTELTGIEQDLGAALDDLKGQTAGHWSRLVFMLGALASQQAVPGEYAAHLERLLLTAPANVKERMWRRLIIHSLKRTGVSAVRSD
jgi:hypothetical protein